MAIEAFLFLLSDYRVVGVVKFLESRCKVCKSPNREKYEELRLKERKSLEDLEKLSIEWEGDKISYGSFARHFANKHPEQVLEEALNRDKAKKELLEEKAKEALDLVADLTRYLRILDNAIKPYLTKKEKLTLKEIFALNATAKNIRETIKLLADLTHRLKFKKEDENEKDSLLKVLDKLSPEASREVYEAMKSEGLL